MRHHSSEKDFQALCEKSVPKNTPSFTSPIRIYRYSKKIFKNLKNKPENPFQNYDVAKKTLKTNHDFFHSLRKKTHFKEKTG